MAEFTKELKQDLDNLYTLRDEVRVRLHLCSQEAREKWNTLETELDRLHDNAIPATKHSLSELAHQLREFRSNIKGKPD